jgi:hypothetical protein
MVTPLAGNQSVVLAKAGKKQVDKVSSVGKSLSVLFKAPFSVERA